MRLKCNKRFITFVNFFIIKLQWAIKELLCYSNLSHQQLGELDAYNLLPQTTVVVIPS